MSKVHTAPTVSPSSFDLPLYISEIPQLDLSAALMRNLAGSCDFAIVGAARKLFNSVRDEVFNSTMEYESIAELNSAFNEQSFAEENFHAAGSDTMSYVDTIKSLYPLRESWIEQAKELTSLTVSWDGKINKYEPKDIEEQICDPEIKVTQKTIGRIKRQVERKAVEFGIDEDDKQRTISNRLEREMESNADMKDKMRKTSKGVLYMLQAAISANTEEVTTEINGSRKSTEGDCHRVVHAVGEPDFHLLPYALRFKLISDAIKHTELQAQWACKNGNLSDDEFDTLDMLCSKTVKTLRAVINSPQFKTALAQVEASEHMTG